MLHCFLPSHSLVAAGKLLLWGSEELEWLASSRAAAVPKRATCTKCQRCQLMALPCTAPLQPLESSSSPKGKALGHSKSADSLSEEQEQLIEASVVKAGNGDSPQGATQRHLQTQTSVHYQDPHLQVRCCLLAMG